MTSGDYQISVFSEKLNRRMSNNEDLKAGYNVSSAYYFVFIYLFSTDRFCSFVGTLIKSLVHMLKIHFDPNDLS